jgi:hypothetical protein
LAILSNQLRMVRPSFWISGGMARLSERAVAKHTASIFLRLGLQPSEDDNRRVLAVLAYLGT